MIGATLARRLTALSWRQPPGTPCYAADFDVSWLKESLAAADRRRPRVLRVAAAVAVNLPSQSPNGDGRGFTFGGE